MCLSRSTKETPRRLLFARSRKNCSHTAERKKKKKRVGQVGARVDKSPPRNYAAAAVAKIDEPRKLGI